MSTWGPFLAKPSFHSFQCRQVQTNYRRARNPRCTAPGWGDRVPGADVRGAVQGPGGCPWARAGQPGEPGWAGRAAVEQAGLLVTWNSVSHILSPDIFSGFSAGAVKNQSSNHPSQKQCSVVAPRPGEGVGGRGHRGREHSAALCLSRGRPRQQREGQRLLHGACFPPGHSHPCSDPPPVAKMGTSPLRYGIKGATSRCSSRAACFSHIADVTNVTLRQSLRIGKKAASTCP